jgi:hypothetical protein
VGGYFYNVNKIDINTNSLLFGLIIFLSAFIDSIVFNFLNTTIDTEIPIVTVLLYNGLMPALYTAVISLVIMIFFTKRVFYEQ